MRHFACLPDDVLAEVFERLPGELSHTSPARLRAVALGATLYMPGTRPRLAADVLRRSAEGVMSVVLCLEDAVADEDLPAAEANVVAQVVELAAVSTRDDAPMVFVRVRTPQQIGALVARMGPAVGRLAGFVLPKFTAVSGPPFLAAVGAAEARAGVPLDVMPVLESAEIMYTETRRTALRDVRALLERHRARVLAVRLGAADLSGLYGLRRTRGVSVYDVGVLRDVIADVVNVLGRADGSGFVIAGPVWEHYAAAERLFKPLLRATPFEGDQGGRRLREDLLTADHDELLREVVLDRANGLTGKTVIHPSHIAPVHSLMVVSHEEHQDALAIAASTGGGASGSASGTRMNEAGPHRAWAVQLLERATVFGVAREGHGTVDVLSALTRQARGG